MVIEDEEPYLKLPHFIEASPKRVVIDNPVKHFELSNMISLSPTYSPTTTSTPKQQCAS